MLASNALAAMRALPTADAAQIAGGRPVLVLAPHPDDEVLGCGGLCLSLAATGIAPAILFLTDGTGSHPNSRAWPAPRLRDLREAEARTAAGLLGVRPDRVGFLRRRDTAAPTEGPAFECTVAAVAAACTEWDCATICAPWRCDPHCDHLAAHLIAAQAAARIGVRHLAYPVWGWTLAPGTELGALDIAGARLELGASTAIKRQALQAHASQFGQVIDDDPGGFCLDGATLELMLHPFEVFLDPP